jgi:hypothetical protein
VRRRLPRVRRAALLPLRCAALRTARLATEYLFGLDEREIMANSENQKAKCALLWLHARRNAQHATRNTQHLKPARTM